MKTRRYNIYKAGSVQVATIVAGCITKAAEIFVATLESPASYKLSSKQQASVRYKDNYSLMDNFVIIEV